MQHYIIRVCWIGQPRDAPNRGAGDKMRAARLLRIKQERWPLAGTAGPRSRDRDSFCACKDGFPAQAQESWFCFKACLLYPSCWLPFAN